MFSPCPIRIENILRTYYKDQQVSSVQENNCCSLCHTKHTLCANCRIRCSSKHATTDITTVPSRAKRPKYNYRRQITSGRTKLSSYSASNLNDYQKHINNVFGEQSAAGKFTVICEPIV
jgi:hypothetical protein